MNIILAAMKLSFPLEHRYRIFSSSVPSPQRKQSENTHSRLGLVKRSTTQNFFVKTSPNIILKILNTLEKKSDWYNILYSRKKVSSLKDLKTSGILKFI
ncbi:hypothetical protein QTP88_024261 [Uroleucon formosanum]